MELVSRAHLQWKRQIARNLLPWGLNPKQIYVLRKLSESERGLSPSHIADLLFSDRPTATSMINTLERSGWVTRTPDPENGKRVLVQITGSGRRKLRSVPEHLWRTGKTEFDPESALTAAERAELIRLLEKLNAALDNDRKTRSSTS